MGLPGQGSLATSNEGQEGLSGGIVVRGYGSKLESSQEMANTNRKCQSLWGVFLKVMSNSQGGFWRLAFPTPEEVSCLS